MNKTTLVNFYNVSKLVYLSTTKPLSLTFYLIMCIGLNTINAQTDLIPYRKGNKWGFIDKTGKIVIPCKYNTAYPFDKGIAWVRLNDAKRGYISKNGTEYWED